jgi:hypothetical protein
MMTESPEGKRSYRAVNGIGRIAQRWHKAVAMDINGVGYLKA